MSYHGCYDPSIRMGCIWYCVIWPIRTAFLGRSARETSDSASATTLGDSDSEDFGGLLESHEVVIPRYIHCFCMLLRVWRLKSTEFLRIMNYSIILSSTITNPKSTGIMGWRSHGGVGYLPCRVKFARCSLLPLPDLFEADFKWPFWTRSVAAESKLYSFF